LLSLFAERTAARTISYSEAGAMTAYCVFYRKCDRRVSVLLYCYLLDSLILHFLLDFSVKKINMIEVGVVVKIPQDAHIFELLVLAVTLYMMTNNICGSCYSSLATLPNLGSRWKN
jgi:hypothetical protein